MADSSKPVGSMCFGPYELSLESEELRKDGQRLKLSGQAIQVLDVQLRLRKCLPRIGVSRSDRDDSSTQLDDRGFIASFLRLRKLRAQSRNIAVCGAQRNRRAQD